MSDSDPVVRPRMRWSWLLAVAYVVAGALLYSWDQDFPYLYHTDEPSKVQQVQRRGFNFHHPLLLLRSTEALIEVTAAPMDAQTVVEKGRLASAIFAAFAVGAVTVLAGRLAGTGAAALAGALALTHPVLFELAHYMKEDCALLVGLMSTLAALAFYGGRPTVGHALLVGMAAGLAVSGKYLGCTVAILAMLTIALLPAARRWASLGVALVGMIGVFAAINYPGFREPDRVSASLAKELEKVEKRAQERPEPIRFKHLSKIGTSLSVPLLLGLIFWFRRRWQARRSEPITVRALGFFLLAYFLIVSLAPKTKDRYLLPVYVIACALGAVGLVEWMRATRVSPRPFLRWAPALLMAVALVWHVIPLRGVYDAFAQDDRLEMAEFIQANVAPSAAVAQDVRVLLARAKEAGLDGFTLPNAFLVPPDRYVADLGSLEELRARGVTHVAVCEADYHNALKPGSSGRMKERGEWYQRLFSEGRLVWERPVGPVAYLQPGLGMYAIAEEGKQATASPQGGGSGARP